MKFADINLSPELKAALSKMGYSEMTPIQAEVLPIALQGRDIIGQAQTGTGKTAAYGIPIVEQVTVGDDLQAVILAPARELAVQIYNELKNIAAEKRLRIVNIIGGVSYTLQERDLIRKPNIIVATPGRFIDNYDKRLINVAKVRFLTLDEADEMLNFGFQKEITKIFKMLPAQKQIFFLTATFNKRIRDLAAEMLKTPYEVSISQGAKTSETITQRYVLVREREKFKALAVLLTTFHPRGVIVFCRTRQRVDEVKNALLKIGYEAVAIQGDMKQRDRSQALSRFKTGQIKVIIGTDVLARGIDIVDVDYVFNFDLPLEIEGYTHRIGRTGRAGRVGTAISLVRPDELDYFDEIKRKTGSAPTQIHLPSEETFAVERVNEYLALANGAAAIGYNKNLVETLEKMSPADLKNLALYFISEEIRRIADVKLTMDHNDGSSAITNRRRSSGGQSPNRFRRSYPSNGPKRH